MLKLLFAVGLAMVAGFLCLVAAVEILIWPSRISPDATATGLPIENVTFASGSGSRIAAWYAPGAPGAAGIVLMHGVRANRDAMAGRMRLLHAAGYAVLAFDFQAHGDSQGTAITFGRLESMDCRAAVDWLRARLPGAKIGAIGVSLGGASALLATPPIDTDALVVESVFPDIELAINDRLTARLGPLGRFVTPAFLAVGKLVTGLEPDQLRPIDGLAKIAAPVFILSGTADQNTLIDETREMFARAAEPKQLW